MNASVKTAVNGSTALQHVLKCAEAGFRIDPIIFSAYCDILGHGLLEHGKLYFKLFSMSFLLHEVD